MGREVRMVPGDWDHPKENDRYSCLQVNYDRDKAEFEKLFHEKGLQEALDYMVAPDINDYMPEWPESERTHYQMYENTSEGTPISPPMESPEKLARWLADNNASSFGRETATYEQWMAMIVRTGYAPSFVIDSGGMRSGVADVSRND